ncbi:MAG: hypothetical protein KF883_11770 [Thermomicrobiales bacterium]|nr:hypothetical protein [Thermomicrobiales bacterium]
MIHLVDDQKSVMPSLTLLWRPLALLLLMLGSAWAVTPGQATAQKATPEEELALRYSPIAMFQEQPEPCSPFGEPYQVLPVESVLGFDEVELREHVSGRSPDPVLMNGPETADLTNDDMSVYMDFPGSALRPGCDFETWERERAEALGLEQTVYARIATQEGAEGLALQYWFWYVYNDWNNLHEGDWEMIQLTWDVSSVEEALQAEPVSITYSQHGGSERAPWRDDRLTIEGDTHPVVFVSAGSHAAYFQSTIWIGWDRTTGVGCDNTEGPSVRVPVDVIVIPQEIDPDGEFAWLLWDGRWGERQPWEFNGPRGPSGAKWNQPVTWIDGARSFSLSLPRSSTIGPGPTSLFCSISEASGIMLARLPGIGRVMTAILLAAIAVPFIFAAIASRYVVKGARMYIRNIHQFLLASVAVFLVASGANWFEQRLIQWGAGSELIQWTQDVSLARFITGIGLGGFQQLALGLLVAPAVIQATYQLFRTDRIDWKIGWSIALTRFPTSVGAIAVTVAIFLALSSTIILFPLALFLGVRWLFVGQAVIIDNAGMFADSRRRSSQIVAGYWMVALGFALLMVFLTGIVGPLVAMVLLVVTSISMNTAEIISGIIYSMAYPIAIMAATMFYLVRRDGADTADPLTEEPGAELTGDLQPAT